MYAHGIATFRPQEHRSYRRRRKTVHRAPLSSIPARTCPPGQPTSPFADGFVPLPRIAGRVDFTPQGVNQFAQRVMRFTNLFVGKAIKVSPQTGTVEHVLSDNVGDGSGLTGVGGGGLTIVNASSNYTASAGELVVATASNLVISLPASPSVGDRVGVKNTQGVPYTSVNRNGNTIDGSASDDNFGADTQYGEYKFRGSGDWIKIASA